MSARLPFIFGDPYRVHWGVVLAVGVALLMGWVIFKTTLGFEIRTVGQNSKAARYAGMNVRWIVILTMMIAGGLAGLAGGIETLGLNHKFAPEFTGGVGFDGITVALLGQANPLGVIASALLLGAMDAGAGRMQFDSGVPADIILIIQGLVLAFVAAPTIIREIYRIRRPPRDADQKTVLGAGWGK
jgi:simple sugar transport system permease protein